MNLNIGKSVDGKAFALPEDLATQTQAIIATKGKGKTYLAMVQTEEMLKASIPAVCLDPTGVWWGLQADGTGKGFPIIVMGGEHGNVPLEPNAGEIVAQFIVESNQSVVLDLSAFESNAAQDRFVTAFAEKFYRLKAKTRTAVHIMVDEADSVMPQRPMPGQQRMLGAFEAIVRRGRSRGIGITLITQRPAVLNKNVLMMAELLTCLGIVGPIDQKAVAEWVKYHGEEDKRDAFLSSLGSLPKGRAWFWSPSWLQCFTQVDVRAKQTFDSSRTPGAGEKFIAPKNVAAPDLDSLTAQIKATIERAKADDPKELKRKIADLQKQVAANPEAKPCNHLEEIAILKAENKLQSGILNSLHTFKNSVTRRIVSMQQSLTDLQKTIDDQLAGHFLEEAAKSQARMDKFKGYGDPVKPLAVRKALTIPKAKEPNSRIRESANSDITNSQRKILNVLGWLENYGISPATVGMIAAHAGYAVGGGAFNNILSRLNTTGLISRVGGGLIELSNVGRGQASPSDHISGNVLESWYAKIGNSKAKMLRTLVTCYPESLTKQELADRIGEAAGGGAFNNKCSALKTLGLIEYPAQGRVKASDLLFINPA
ncbi:MAG: hypothetical protein WBP42_02520 [Candidatus Zixiibacteriota bacterium]